MDGLIGSSGSLDEFEHERRSDDPELHDPARRVAADVEQRRRLAARHLHLEDTERPGRHRHAVLADHLHGDHLGARVARREDVDAEALSRREWQGGHDHLDGVIVIRGRGDRRVDRERLRRPALLGHDGGPLHPPGAVREMHLVRLAPCGTGLIHPLHAQVRGIEHYGELLLPGSAQNEGLVEDERVGGTTHGRGPRAERLPWSSTTKLSLRATSCAASSGSGPAFAIRSAGASGWPSRSSIRTGAIAFRRSYSLAPSPATTSEKAPAWYRRCAAARAWSGRTALSRSRYSRR